MWEQETVSYINKINNFNPEYKIWSSALGSFTEWSMHEKTQ
jgi:hypothetical protein